MPFMRLAFLEQTFELVTLCQMNPEVGEKAALDEVKRLAIEKITAEIKSNVWVGSFAEWVQKSEKGTAAKVRMIADRERCEQLAQELEAAAEQVVLGLKEMRGQGQGPVVEHGDAAHTQPSTPIDTTGSEHKRKRKRVGEEEIEKRVEAFDECHKRWKLANTKT